MSYRKPEHRADPSQVGNQASKVEQRCAELLDRCRSRGIRITPQRLAVYRELARDGSHPTAESIYDGLRPGMASLSLATVYRILEFLEREQLVRRVSTTDAAARFDANVARHHHLVCRACGTMTDIEGESLLRRALPRVVPRTFRAEELDIRILGTCQPCRRAASGQRRNNRAPKRKNREK